MEKAEMKVLSFSVSDVIATSGAPHTVESSFSDNSLRLYFGIEFTTEDLTLYMTDPETGDLIVDEETGEYITYQQTAKHACGLCLLSQDGTQLFFDEEQIALYNAQGENITNTADENCNLKHLGYYHYQLKHQSIEFGDDDEEPVIKYIIVDPDNISEADWINNNDEYFIFALQECDDASHHSN